MNIKNIFKKKRKNKLLFHLFNNSEEIEINDILEPCSSNYPPYWKDLSKNQSLSTYVKNRNYINQFDRGLISEEEMDKISTPDFVYLGNGRSRINAGVCPSFVNIFKNSYIYKTPCEIYVEGNENGIEVYPSDPEVLAITSHPLSAQLWGDFNNNLTNIKFNIQCVVKTTYKNARMIFLDSIYYSDLPFKVMPGVLDVSSKYTVSFNINTTIDKRFFNKPYKKTIKPGTPLAMVYMPDGVLDIETTKLQKSPRKYHYADYIKKLNEK